MSTDLGLRRGLVVAVLVVAVLFTLAACGGGDSSNPGQGMMDTGTGMMGNR